MQGLRPFDANVFASKLNAAKSNLNGKHEAAHKSATERLVPESSSWLGNLGVALPDLSGFVSAATQKGTEHAVAAAGRTKGLVRSASATISENAISRQRW
eukprot:CAMPEP_0171093526 /NCGR_PEP_ID=MMETSP0766_2-20121228/39129_1 /TAXON_ID=439317 /ORGANISM="Gambierdiscus australes, Strain CAWD 149" /LENGTH=99 /DNA_ID=CAMNT_0011551985 /DNA_START=47 /DNA_END=343 /DNA_ORIENTATION=+